MIPSASAVMMMIQPPSLWWFLSPSRSRLSQHLLVQLCATTPADHLQTPTMATHPCTSCNTLLDLLGSITHSLDPNLHAACDEEQSAHSLQPLTSFPLAISFVTHKLPSMIFTIIWPYQTANIMMLNAIQIVQKFNLKWRDGWHKGRDHIPPHLMIMVIKGKLVTAVVVGQLHGLIPMITLIMKIQTSSRSISFLFCHPLTASSRFPSCKAGIYNTLSMIILIFHSITAQTILLCQVSIVTSMNCLGSTIWNPEGHFPHFCKHLPTLAHYLLLMMKMELRSLSPHPITIMEQFLLWSHLTVAIGLTAIVRLSCVLCVFSFFGLSASVVFPVCYMHTLLDHALFRSAPC